MCIRDSFYPEDCQDGGQVEPQVNRTYGWTDVSANRNANDGEMEIRWHFEDLVVNQSYAFEWLEFRNGDYTGHHVVEFTPTSDEHYQPFNLTVESASTCDIRLEGSLYVLVSGRYIEVFYDSDYLYPNCNYAGDFNQFPLLVQNQTTDEYSVPDSIGNGDQSFRFDLSGLIDNRTYYLHGNINTNLDSESWHWGQFTPSEQPDYVEVNMTISEWTCTVSAHLYIYVHMLDDNHRTIRSDTDQIDSSCINPGDFELEIGSIEVGYGMGLVNGTNDMTWNLTDLAQDQTYTFDWRVEYNNDDVLYMHETWDTDDNSSRLIDWDLEINTSAVCNARIEFRAYIDMTGDGEWIMMESRSFYENFECDQQVYPRDHYVTIHGEVNGTWVAEPDPLPFGYDVISLGFENLTVDEEYQMYFYHSGTGFDSSSEWFTFTYEGGLLGYRMPIAPWACTIQYTTTTSTRWTSGATATGTWARTT